MREKSARAEVQVRGDTVMSRVCDVSSNESRECCHTSARSRGTASSGPSRPEGRCGLSHDGVLYNTRVVRSVLCNARVMTARHRVVATRRGAPHSVGREFQSPRRTRYEARARATARTRGGGAGRASRRVLHGAGPACYATRRVIVTRRRVMQHATPFPMAH